MIITAYCIRHLDGRFVLDESELGGDVRLINPEVDQVLPTVYSSAVDAAENVGYAFNCLVDDYPDLTVNDLTLVEAKIGLPDQ